MSLGEFFKALKLEFKKDRISDVAGAVTFAGVLALFPFILFLVALAGVVIDPAQTQELITQLGQVAPPDVTNILAERLKSLTTAESGSVLGLSALTAIWAASGGMNALIRALNTTYGVEEGRPFWKVRGIAILMVLITAVLVLSAAMIAIAIPAVAAWVGGPVGTLIVWLRMPMAGLLMMFVWAMLYYALPDVQQKFKFITPGSVIGVLVWVLASYGFSKYVSNFGKYEATYGALGGIIVMLLWMWISAQVLLMGAEINAIIEHKSEEGKRAGAKSVKDTGGGETKHEKAQRKGYDTERPWDQPSVHARARATHRDRLRHPAGPEEKLSKLEKAKLGAWGIGAAVSYLATRKRRVPSAHP